MNHSTIAKMSIVLSALLWASAARASVMPYNQDFESGSPAGVVIGNASASTNTWSVVADGGGNHWYQNVLGTGSVKGFASLPLTNLGPASSADDFDISVILNPLGVPVDSANYTAGLRFLATDSGDVNSSYVADLNVSAANGGRMRIVKWVGSTATVYPSSTQSQTPLVPNFSTADSYVLDVKGTYDASNDLTLVYTVTQVGAPANTQSYTYSADATPNTGQYFGMYDSIGGGGTSMTVEYDNLSVVPEPATMSLLGFGALALIRRRRNA